MPLTKADSELIELCGMRPAHKDVDNALRLIAPCLVELAKHNQRFADAGLMIISILATYFPTINDTTYCNPNPETLMAKEDFDNLDAETATKH
jgi:hypothetical protein